MGEKENVVKQNGELCVNSDGGAAYLIPVGSPPNAFLTTTCRQGNHPG